ncbi:hypothetical protein GCM10009853_077050 [Glycomyces scopariae]
MRAAVGELNTRIRKALIGPVEGPPLRFGPVDADEAVAAWRSRR